MLDTGLIFAISERSTGFHIDWKNGESSLFHYVWLRDCCYCEDCGDCHSSFRQYVPSMDSLKARPGSFSWNKDELCIEWGNDAHQSVYSVEWLNENRYDDRARSSRRFTYSSWNASTNLPDLSFDFEQVSTNEVSRLELQTRLISHGVVIVRGGTCSVGSVISFAELTGEVEQSAYGAVFDLRPGNAAGTAGIETLACVQPAESGGDSILVDGFGIAQALREDHPLCFESLATWNHHYVRFHPGKLYQRAHVPIISLDDDGEISGIRLHTRASAPLDLPENVMETYLEAYHRLCTMMLAPENQMRVSLGPGDAIIFDNHRALHARTAFSDQRRFLQICSVSREKFHESFRLLATRLGYFELANKVLRAGSCR
ncbi:MAG: DUF971 domain-containing protein [Gammaproteobacteria bacterium]|nr:DUF971 domain-containing protein [Gammaproteobacteria bacterium]